MSTKISSWDSSSISTLFSSLNSSKSSSSSSVLDLDLSTYSLIKSGTYYKMMKSYYSEDSTSTSTSTSSDSAKTLTSIQSDADDLTDSAETLYKSTSSVFKKTSTTDQDGNTTSAYDTDAIYEAVEDFVEDYNSFIKAASKSNTSSIASSSASLVNYLKSNSSTLESVGISMDSSDYTLEIDEDKFKKADMSTVKSLFNGNGSVAYSVAVKASMIGNYAKTESTKSATYGSSGTYTYNYSTGELYNTTT